ncbi:ABC transporter substrate-binding protein [Nocardioides zeae]|uniref:ABC transporter substrate-binding protein n=1 Tax=Nocardioides zeae TaxID=1457234 RepID=A0A6P0HMP8_9ACTN|nr:ABC transporter substrate-binding protein [Nocardioides zeae]NEN79901.1 ABC transporter substrate-binding protein [Nocardioides zeae]
MLRSVTTRRTTAVLAAAATLSGLTACGSDAADEGSAGEGAHAGTRSVDGVYGRVEVEGVPQRVVALTPQAADILLSLGVQPVAVAMTAEEEPTYPWLDGALTGEIDPHLLAGFVASPEAVAAHDPDLIVGAAWAVPEDVHRQLEDVAPTFAGLTEGNDDWDDLALALAELTGTDGAGVVAGVGDACEAAAAELPHLAGDTYQYVAAEQGRYRFGNGAWLECFGLVPAADQDNTQVGEAGVAEENLTDLDADVLAIFDRLGVRSALEDDARFTGLPSSNGGAVLWLDAALANATNSPGPLSFAYVIEQVQPVLASDGGRD